MSEEDLEEKVEELEELTDMAREAAATGNYTMMQDYLDAAEQILDEFNEEDNSDEAYARWMKGIQSEAHDIHDEIRQTCLEKGIENMLSQAETAAKEGHKYTAKQRITVAKDYEKELDLRYNIKSNISGRIAKIQSTSAKESYPNTIRHGDFLENSRRKNYEEIPILKEKLAKNGQSDIPVEFRDYDPGGQAEKADYMPGEPWKNLKQEPISNPYNIPQYRLN